MARPQGDNPKEKYQIALHPEVQKSLRVLAAEYDVFPGDVIESLVGLAETIKAMDEAGEFEKLDPQASRVFTLLTKWLEEGSHRALKSREERREEQRAYEKAKAAGPKALTEYLRQRIAEMQAKYKD